MRQERLDLDERHEHERSPRQFGMRHLQILLVEDEALILFTLQDMLEDLGCVVADVALRIEDAVAKAASVACDVAILDVNVAGERIDRALALLTGWTRVDVQALIAQGQFDYTCWDLYAKISQYYKDNPDSLQWRRDTLHAIGRRFAVSVDKLREWNRLTGPDVRAGQKLVLYLGRESDYGG